MELRQDHEVGDHQADHHHRLQGDQTSEIVHLGEAVAAVSAGVAEVVEDHHHDHQHRVANAQDVEGGAANILGLDIELKITLESGLVMMVMKKLINDQERGPVSSVSVNEQRK